MTERTGRKAWGQLCAVLLLIVAALVAPSAVALEPAGQRVGTSVSTGTHVGLTLESGLIERDVWSGAVLSIGFESRLFGLQLRAPFYLRTVDLDPATPRPTGACEVIRCEVVGLRDGAFAIDGLSQIIDQVRLGRPSDLVFVRGGGMLLTLGSGRLVDRYVNRVDPDRPQTGLFVKTGVPSFGLSLESFVGNLFVPQKMAAGRLGWRPFFAGTEANDPGAAWLGRAELSVEVAGDFVLDNPSLSPGTFSPLVGGVAELQWPMFEPVGFIQLTPFVAGSALYGLSETGTALPALGTGASAGLRLDLVLPYVALRLEAAPQYDAKAHRTGVFGLLYDIERREAWRGSASAGSSLLTVPAPGGLGYRAQIELAVLSFLRLGARYRAEPAPGASAGECFGDVALGSFRLALHALLRDLEQPRDLQRPDAPLFVVADASFGVWGPFSLFSRVRHGPRFVADKLRTDTDFQVGLSFDLLLAPAGER